MTAFCSKNPSAVNECRMVKGESAESCSDEDKQRKTLEKNAKYKKRVTKGKVGSSRIVACLRQTRKTSASSGKRTLRAQNRLHIINPRIKHYQVAANCNFAR